MNRFLAVSLMGVLLAAAAFGDVWYVNESATGAEDGTSWSTAYRTIQPAIDAVYYDGGGEVWVAEGIYDEPRVSFLGDPCQAPIL